MDWINWPKHRWFKNIESKRESLFAYWIAKGDRRDLNLHVHEEVKQTTAIRTLGLAALSADCTRCLHFKQKQEEELRLTK